MAKQKQNPTKRSSGARGGSVPRGRADAQGSKTAEEPDAALETATEKLRHARQSLEDAEREYADALDEESLDFERLRNVSLGEAIDKTLEWVREHPGAGMIAAVTAGFLAGRVTKRIW